MMKVHYTFMTADQRHAWGESLVVADTAEAALASFERTATCFVLRNLRNIEISWQAGQNTWYVLGGAGPVVRGFIKKHKEPL